MAQNITLLGASYSDVPAVTLPKTGGGTASFTDVTDTTAGASDVASGKYFYTASGVRTQGTASGGATLQAKTNINPTTSSQTITADTGYDGLSSVQINGDANLVAGNIKSGVSIFGVSGSSSVVDTTIASGGAAAGNIISGYKAYVNGSLVEGSATVPTVSQNSTTKVLSIS